MSGFESNPFADPEVNPFSDPSVTQATRNVANSQRGLEDYNPFADQGSGRVVGARGASNPPKYPTQPMSGNQPAVMQPTSDMPPSYTPQQRVTTEELQRRQEELERKAADLQRREDELRNAPFNARTNNWPPLPKNFCVQPCFYQDINVDIPLEFQKTVRTMYYLWMVDAAVMFLNILGAMAIMIGVGNGAIFGTSIVYFFIFTPAAYICWFRPIYKAFRSDSSFNFFGIFAIGIPGMGVCGWIVSLQSYGDSIGAGVCSTFVSIGLTVVAIANVFLLLKIHNMYRSTGASFAKAQQEFASGVLRNEHVQTAAANAAAGAVRQTVAPQNRGNRY